MMQVGTFLLVSRSFKTKGHLKLVIISPYLFFSFAEVRADSFSVHPNVVASNSLYSVISKGYYAQLALPWCPK